MAGRSAGEAWYEVAAKIDKLDDALDKADKRIEQTGDKAERGLSGRLTNALGKVGGGVATVAKTALIAGGVAVGGLGVIGGIAVKGAAEWETYNAQFTTFLGSAEAAGDRMKELADFGARTPFELDEIVRADRVLTAFGIHSQRNLEAVGNAAAASGATYEEVATTFSRVTAGQFGEAFQRLAELGIATRADLEMKGLEFDKGGSYVGTAEDAAEAVTQIIEEKFGAHGDVPSVMESMSNTTAGQFSNLQDNLAQTFREIGAILLPVVKAMIDGLNTALPVLKDFFIGVFTQAKPILEGVGDVLGDMLNLIATIFDDPSQIGDFGDQFAGMGGLVVSAVEFIQSAIEQAWPILLSAFESALQIAQAVFPVIMDVATAAFTAIGDVVDAVAPVVTDALTWISEEVVPPLLEVFEGLHAWIVENWPTISAIIDTAAQIIGGALEAVINVLKVLWPIVVEIGRVVIPIIGAAFEAVLPFIQGFLEVLSGLIDWLNQNFMPAVETVGAAFAAVWEAVGGFFTGLWNGLLQVVGTIVGTMIGIIKNIIGIAADIPGPWQEGAQKMRDSLEDMEEAAKTWGKDTDTTLTSSYEEQRRKAGYYGSLTAQAYANSFADSGDYLAQKIATMQATGMRYMEAASPPKYGPFARIDEWGANTAEAYAEAFGAKGRDLARYVASMQEEAQRALQPDVGANVSSTRTIEAVLRLKIEGDPEVVRAIPGGAAGVSEALTKMIDATGLLRSLRHEVLVAG